MSEESPNTTASKSLDSKTVESYTKMILAFVAVLGFLWGVFQYLDGQKQEAETRRIEATRPYLERQLRLYTEATQVVASIATAKDDTPNGSSGEPASTEESDDTRAEDPVARFWELYWGELALVEDRRVEAAMAKYGDALLAEESRETLQELSLALAHACRDSLAESWGVKEWKRPLYDAD